MPSSVCLARKEKIYYAENIAIDAGMTSKIENGLYFIRLRGLKQNEAKDELQGL